MATSHEPSSQNDGSGSQGPTPDLSGDWGSPDPGGNQVRTYDFSGDYGTPIDGGWSYLDAMAPYPGWLSLFSDIVGILGAFFALMAWLGLRAMAKNARKGVEETGAVDKDNQMPGACHEGVGAEKPFAVAISLSDIIPSIEGDVRGYLTGCGCDMPITELHYNKEITPEDVDAYIQDLAKMRCELETKGATEIHLFINAPVQAATVAGAMFGHWKPVKLYQRNNRTCQYECWGPLIKL